MKKHYMVFISIILVTIGYAAISSILDIHGNTDIGFNYDDFKVYISFIGINDSNTSENISEDKTSFSISVNKDDIVYYEVTNDSYQYDVDITLICDNEDGIEINQIGELKAQSISRKDILVSQDKAITCRIEIKKIERTSIADDNLLKKWFAFENMRDKSQDEVFSNSEYFNRLIENSEALDFLINNPELIKIVKEDRNYESVLVPKLLNHAISSKEENNKFYNAKLPCYIYNNGTYYLISSMTYQGPSNSCQTHAHSNTSQGLYFHLVGTTSGSGSYGVHYSNQSINPNGYSNLGIKSYFTTNLSQHDIAIVGLYNGSPTSEKWMASFTGALTSTQLKLGESEKLLQLPNVNSTYRIVITQLVNYFQVSGNYYNTAYLRTLWLQ